MDFNAVDRRGTYTTKLDDAVKKFGTDDLMPLWVADMDLASPECVQHALRKEQNILCMGILSILNAIMMPYWNG